MKRTLPRLSKLFFLQITLYLFINGMFILKYFPRTGISSSIILSLFVAFILLTTYLYSAYSTRIADKIFKIAFWVLLTIMILTIVGLLIVINRYSVRVDRWSAVTFFLDNFFQGKYPYSAHTHVSNSNFPSPFPFWYIINIPFYLLGDVGIGLIFFLGITAILVKQFFSTYRRSFFFLQMLCLAPAYWWEVAVRSDSLSNALLVFTFILWFKKKNYSLSNNFWLCIIVCGLIASTRLSAILPLALFFFKSFTQLQWRRKVHFLTGVLGMTLLTFMPFIFWDTKKWIFFSRNPFMSQTSIGNSYLLLIMIILGCIMAYRWTNASQFFSSTSLFLFIFVLATQITLIITRGIKGSIFTDSLYDISYFSLLLPYCLAYVSCEINDPKQLNSIE